jgi:hypothetical protein
MTKAYSAIRQEIAKQSDSALTCTTCGAATPWETLSNLGTRCRSCYDAYCREGIKLRPQAQSALPRTPGRVNVLSDHHEPRSAGPEHAADALPFN